MAPVAEAAPGLGTVKHYRLPTSTDPHDVTTASDGNVWFTVQGAFDPVTFFTPGSVARVTPRGDITEFAVCDTCITNDIVEGPDGILYISDNDGQLRRITTSGEVLSSIPVEGAGPARRRRGGLDQHLVRGFLQQQGRSLQRLRRGG